MILFLNVFVTEKRFVQFDSRYKKHFADHRFAPSRLSVFYYMLASLAVIPWKHVIIYYQLDEMFQDHIKETNKYIDELFENALIYNYRNDRQDKWQTATQKILDISGDDLVWFSCEDDHIFIDYELNLHKKIQKKLEKMKKKHEFVSCYYSHWPEMFALSHKSKAPVRWNREIIETNSLYNVIKWRNSDGVSIINKNLMKYWWFSHDYGNRILRRTDDHESGAIESPEIYTIIPNRELVRHFDGYSHVGIDKNLCPPLFIPEGFFENKIRIQYGCKEKKQCFTSVNPLLRGYTTMDKQGADLRCLIGKIPLFWKDRISKMENAKVLDQNLLISGHNRALLQLACSGNALQRGDMNPIRAIKIIKFTCIINYPHFNSIFLFRDALLTFGLNDYKNLLSSKVPRMVKFLKTIRSFFTGIYNTSTR
jgi:hypothetical protein